MRAEKEYNAIMSHNFDAILPAALIKRKLSLNAERVQRERTREHVIEIIEDGYRKKVSQRKTMIIKIAQNFLYRFHC